MKQSELPKFVSVQFYPGYEYAGYNGPGRYVALGEDGRVYVFTIGAGNKKEWELLGDNSVNSNET